ncbi:FMN-binding negative transcriptional regulator [Sphingomonas hengshuiensis]|uniref:Transcriptional regulator n=1 Tax=Sphingomonas hengshuiensis TaxID=1609977 RepID=A0A7U4J8A8_9SPHN|nr:FMN-binding negative transcriptional regulator [Sphingomonas hengshuiensis]AJP72105.1 transcriptional regulator [Sphingomonas hengshuiensis]
MSSAFDRFDDSDVRDLIAEYPLAWVVAVGGQSLLPLLGEVDGDGRLTHLLGHMGRSNPLFAQLSADPRATILFTGPQGYVSPDHAQRRNWGPTWNYAQLAITAEIEFLPDEGDAALAALTLAMEGDRWSAAELGPRYTGMAAAIIAFRARVTGLTGRFKLGQDEPDETFSAILRTHPDAALVAWMRRFGKARG